jgi:hypothetical protein
MVAVRAIFTKHRKRSRFVNGTGFAQSDASCRRSRSASCARRRSPR